mmetsp:Transcript_85623/g.239133  ORF Transcript_85623/g.239133 Transcript_85623/m.239133 type:complete len:175 (-) Transcript_85623:102-626(-)
MAVELGAVGDPGTLTKVQQLSEQRDINLQRLGRCTICLTALPVAAMILNFAVELKAANANVSSLRLFKLFKCVGIVVACLLVSALILLNRTKSAPRGFVCLGGCSCMPWTLMIFGAISVLDVTTSLLRDATSIGGAVPWLFMCVSMTNALLLLVLGIRWYKRMRDEQIGYANVA